MTKTERNLVITIVKNGLIHIPHHKGLVYRTARKLEQFGLLACENDVYTFNTRKSITDCGFKMADCYK